MTQLRVSLETSLLNRKEEIKVSSSEWMWEIRELLPDIGYQVKVTEFHGVEIDVVGEVAFFVQETEEGKIEIFLSDDCDPKVGELWRKKNSNVAGSRRPVCYCTFTTVEKMVKEIRELCREYASTIL